MVRCDFRDWIRKALERHIVVGENQSGIWLEKPAYEFATFSIVHVRFDPGAAEKEPQKHLNFLILPK